MSVRLFILGILKHQASHGYQIKKKLSELGVESWADLNWSSVYHALKQMEKEGLVEKKFMGDNGSRPAKEVYSLLEAGRDEFYRLLKDTCASVTVDKNPIYIVLMHLHELSDKEKVELLRKRLAALSEIQEQVERKKASIQNTQILDAHKEQIVFSLLRDLSLREADIKWTKKLLQRYESGS